MSVVAYVSMAKGYDLTRVRLIEGDALQPGWRIIHVEYVLEWR